MFFFLELIENLPSSMGSVHFFDALACSGAFSSNMTLFHEEHFNYRNDLRNGILNYYLAVCPELISAILSNSFACPCFFTEMICRLGIVSGNLK
jgi:hypothetical protein